LKSVLLPIAASGAEPEDQPHYLPDARGMNSKTPNVEVTGFEIKEAE
jgi:hypothetical protein